MEKQNKIPPQFYHKLFQPFLFDVHVYMPVYINWSFKYIGHFQVLFASWRLCGWLRINGRADKKELHLTYYSFFNNIKYTLQKKMQNLHFRQFYRCLSWLEHGADNAKAFTSELDSMSLGGPFLLRIFCDSVHDHNNRVLWYFP